MDLWARGREKEGRVSSRKVLSKSRAVPEPRPPVRRDLEAAIWVRNAGMCMSMAGSEGEECYVSS